MKSEDQHRAFSQAVRAALIAQALGPVEVRAAIHKAVPRVRPTLSVAGLASTSGLAMGVGANGIPVVA